jgi:hypothetical protein
MLPGPLDLDRLLKLRLVVARFGEMDSAKWWNTRGQLGRLGTMALRRGFPRTHYFAQARAVFAVARQRCREVLDSAEVVTLWQLPARIEDQFETRWEYWLDHGSEWLDLFRELENMPGTDLLALLQSCEAVSESDLEAFARLPHPGDGHALALPNPFSGTDQDLALFASGFAHGKPGALVVPFAPRGEP